MTTWEVTFKLETAEIESEEEIRDELHLSLDKNETAYSMKIVGNINVTQGYDPDFGDERICGLATCSHPYYRHFDTYDNMEPVGCKYCDCMKFVK